MPSVFISWGSPDSNAAEALARRLKSIGLEVFFSRDDMRGGQLPVPRVLDEIHAARVGVVALSNESIGREWVRDEIAWCAADLAAPGATMKVLIPVVVGDLDPSRVPHTIKDVHRRSLSNEATFEKDLETLAQDIVDGLGDEVPLTVHAALFALTKSEFEELSQRDEKVFDSLLALCGIAADDGGRQERLGQIFADSYRDRREDFSPFRGELPIKSLVEDAVTRLNIKRRSQNQRAVWLRWDTARLLDPDDRREDALVEQRRANSCITIVDALAAFHGPIREALLNMPVPDDIRRRGVIWISPLFRESSTIEDLINRIARPVNHLQEAFNDWRDVKERSVAFHTGTAISFRQWLWRAVGDLAKDPDPLEDKLAALKAAHPVLIGTKTFFTAGHP